MSQPVDNAAVGRTAHEMMKLLQREIRGDQASSEAFRRRWNYLSVCGPEARTPLSEVAKEMRAIYLQNQQRFDSGRSYDKWLPAVTIEDSRVITARPNYMPGRNLGELLFQPLTDGNIHEVSATAYRKDECVNLQGEPSDVQPRTRSLAPRG
jgi:hypothetical protein